VQEGGEEMGRRMEGEERIEEMKNGRGWRRRNASYYGKNYGG
jgi:hypothetical protein